jgi:Na+/melibiose symporter-like transporter
MAIYLGISQAILSAVDYKNGICAEDQNEYVGRAVTYLISLVPIVAFVLSIISIYFYPIDEKKAKINSKIIQNM